jgi:hypothetical protein
MIRATDSEFPSDRHPLILASPRTKFACVTQDHGNALRNGDHGHAERPPTRRRDRRSGAIVLTRRWIVAADSQDLVSAMDSIHALDPCSRSA